MLEWRGVNVRRDGAVIVRNASLSVAPPGPMWIVGPGGAGKSSLLSALAGDTLDARVEMRGSCTWNGCALPALQPRAVFLPQATVDAACTRRAEHAGASRVGAATRHDAVLRALERDASVYLVDEPTAGLEDAQAEHVRNRLRELSAHAMVVGVTHNRLDCLATGGTTLLLAGGEVHEVAPTQRFFSEPATDAGRVYVETGNCGISVTARPASGGNGIWWVVPGLLCGMSRPGLVGEAADAYLELADHGVHTLLCLEERCAYATEPVRAAGLSLHRFPIPDMAPPSFSQAIDICRLAEPAIHGNDGIAVHCRGGLGRTGTVLAAILVWFGDTAAMAVQRVRAAKPRAIQSEAQQRFLIDFADRIRGWR